MDPQDSEHNIVPTLKHIAAVQFAVEMIGKSYDLSPLLLPKSVKLELLHFASAIIRALDSWKRINLWLVGQRTENFLNLVVWTPRGINYVETAKKFLTLDIFTDSEKYDIAFKYHFEEEMIKYHKPCAAQDSIHLFHWTPPRSAEMFIENIRGKISRPFMSNNSKYRVFAKYYEEEFFGQLTLSLLIWWKQLPKSVLIEVFQFFPVLLLNPHCEIIFYLFKESTPEEKKQLNGSMIFSNILITLTNNFLWKDLYQSAVINDMMKTITSTHLFLVMWTIFSEQITTKNGAKIIWFAAPRKIRIKMLEYAMENSFPTFVSWMKELNRSQQQ